MVSQFYITKKAVIKQIYKKALSLNLPFMERKLGKLSIINR